MNSKPCLRGTVLPHVLDGQLRANSRRHWSST